MNATRVLDKPWASKMINAVLRAYQRQSQSLLEKLPQNAEAFYAHPQWLIDSIKKSWPEQWQSILQNNNAFPPLSLRVNQRQETRQHYLERLSSVGLEAEPILDAPFGLVLKSASDVTLLPGFAKGAFSVQDGAAQLAAELLELAPNFRVLDACAAPGGKTTHILETQPQLELLAIDSVFERSQRIIENLNRLQLNSLKVKVITADASKPSAWWDGKPFDRILLDAPCSATGVIRRHPDIKYLRKPADITKLVHQQIELLHSLWPLLKSGGILVYSTCSILAEENRQTVEKFLKSTNDANPLPIPLNPTVSVPYGYQILPGQNSMDGFYYARFGKA